MTWASRLSSVIPILRGRRVAWRTPSAACVCFLTRKTDLATLDGHQFDLLVQMYNNTPRKCLGYRTPASLLAEIIDNQGLHFKREFSFPLSRE